MSDPTKRCRTIFMIVCALLMTAPCWAQDRFADETLQPVPRCRPRRFTAIYGYDYLYDSLLFRAGAAQEVVPNGGHPDSYLHAVVDSEGPRITAIPLVGQNNLFLGSYRVQEKIALGADINVFDAPADVENRQISLLLRNNGRTPDDPIDDCEVFLISGRHVPKPGRGWKSVDFKVPADSDVLPMGWSVSEGTCLGLTPDEAWRRVIYEVTEMSFMLGEPGVSYDIGTWDIGFDNPRYTTLDACIIKFEETPSMDYDQP